MTRYHFFYWLIFFQGFIAALSMSKMRIILGSGSVTRKMILTQSGYSYDMFKADIDERGLGDRSDASKASELVLLLANAKADAIISNLPSRLIGRILLTADQVVVCKDSILEKPRDADQVREFIKMYATNPCRTVGSIVLTDTATGKRVSGVDTATINFREIPLDIVESLIEKGEVFQCAGGLMIEHPMIQPYIASVEGTMESVMGLSPNLLDSLMTKLLGM